MDDELNDLLCGDPLRKETTQGGSNKIRWATAAAQGMRDAMEDRHVTYHQVPVRIRYPTACSHLPLCKGSRLVGFLCGVRRARAERRQGLLLRTEEIGPRGDKGLVPGERVGLL